MSIAHELARTLALSAVISTAAVAAAHAQVAPAPALPAAPAAPTFKAGWVAQVVSYKANVMGEVPLATFIIGAAQDDAFARLGKLGIPGDQAGLVLRGLINAPEAGRYGFLLTVGSTARQSNCKYSFSVNGTELLTGYGPLANNIGGDKAVDLTVGRHPAELRIGCGGDLPKIRVNLKAKLPAAEQVGPLSTDFIIHPTRAAGD